MYVALSKTAEKFSAEKKYNGVPEHQHYTFGLRQDFNIFGLHVISTGYKFDEHADCTTNNAIRTYHRIAEAFKFAYARRTELGDKEFTNVSKVRTVLTVL